MNKQRGFTLIEILVVIGIIAILASIVIIAINPAKQFAQARNSQRTANVNSILNAIGQRMADNKGVFEGSYTIGGDTYDCDDLVNGIVSVGGAGNDLECLVPTYIPAIPVDPTWTSGTDTLYDIRIDEDCEGNDSPGRIAVIATESDDEDAIPDADTICVVR